MSSVFRIGLFSKIGKTTIKTLRYYEKEGLLLPEYTDRETGYRYYTTSQLVKLHRIQGFRQMGLSISEILDLTSGAEPKSILIKKKADLEEEIRIREAQCKRLDTFLNKQLEDEYMNYQAVLKEIPSCIVYSKRIRIPDYDAMFTLIPAIGAEVTKMNPGIECAVPEYCFNVYHDGEYREKDIDMELCEAVTDFGIEGNGITFKRLPDTLVVSVLHKGPYETIENAYAFIYKWIEESSYEAVDNPRESFIDGIWNKDDKNDWLTEVQVPVKAIKE